MPGPAETAKTTVAAWLDDDPALTASVYAGDPDRLSAATVAVEADEVTWTQWRYLVTLTVAGYFRYVSPSAGDAGITTMMDTLIDRVTAMRSHPDVHWLGPGSELSYAAAGTVEADGKRYASSELTVTVAVPRDDPRVVGSSEQAVRDVLDAAGIVAVDGSDTPPIVVTRWGGAADDDPNSDEVMVVCATEVGSRQIEEYSRSVWGALHASSSVVVTAQLDVDHAGTPPGSDGTYEVAAMTVRVLTVRGE